MSECVSVVLRSEETVRRRSAEDFCRDGLNGVLGMGD
jgi:hypothetical protein